MPLTRDQEGELEGNIIDWSTLGSGQLRILTALVRTELHRQQPARTPGINWAELTHLRDQLQVIETLLDTGQITSIKLEK